MKGRSIRARRPLPLERWLTHHLRGVRARDVTEVGLEVRIGDAEPPVIVADSVATREAVADAMRRFLRLRDEVRP